MALPKLWGLFTNNADQADVAHHSPMQQRESSSPSARGQDLEAGRPNDIPSSPARMQRKHTTTACQICRDSKIKCDGARPACLTCTKKGRRCQYSTKDDKRKVSLRTAVDVLFARVERLTELAVQNNLPLPPLTLADESVLEQICASLELPLRSVLPFPQAQTDLAPLPGSNDGTENAQFAGGAPIAQDVAFNALPVEGQSDPSMASTCRAGQISPRRIPGTGVRRTGHGNSSTIFRASPWNVNSNDQLGSDSTSEDELETDIVPRLAARFGSLRVGADGRVRYYGSAANHHFLANSTRREEMVDAQEMRREALIALENAELDLEVPEALEAHLLDLFFKWHNPGHLTVDRAMFEAARTEGIHGQSTYCSQALIAAMCALGAAFEGRYHHSFITFPKSLAEYFGDKSKVLLELELDSPCMSTLQTMLLLSSHEAAAGRDARLWLYSGSAMRLSFDLGLHIDSDPYVDQGLFTVQEAEARRTCFWSCLVVNHIWSFSLGRPFRVDSEELTVKRLGSTLLSHSDSLALWPTTSSTASPLSHTSQRLKSLSCLVLEQWVYFCEELAPLIRVLYGCAKISKNALQNLSSQTSSRFLKWPESIPEAINIQHDQPTLPQVLLLHMAYHNFCILIHRPWTSKGSQPPGKIGPGFQHARSVCLNAASEIAALLRTYESHYGFRTMNVYVVTIIFSASLILIFGLIAEESSERQQHRGGGGGGLDEASNFARDVNTCFRALDELGQSFESAKRSREDLIALQNHWNQRRREIKLGAKRGRAAQASRFDHASKRSRMLGGGSGSIPSDAPGL
ncbi:Fungal specific transcription factor domain-containing protein isoform 2 [Cladophialophora immunda]|nr:Fungal specific transcription factor domain-containing protein isoform 2 [Cladophialophora immunda]